MLRYFVKRILSTIPVLLIISVIVFSMIHLTPGDPAQSMLGPEASEEQVESCGRPWVYMIRCPYSM